MSSSTSRNDSGKRKYSHTHWEMTSTGYRCPLYDGDTAPTDSPLRHDQPEDHLTRSTNVTAPPTPLGQAFAEYGRIAKTLHLLRVVDPVDDTHRRQMNRQLTVHESRHKLA